MPPLRCSRSAWDRANGPIGCDRRRAVAGRKQRLGARGNRLTDYGGAAGVVGNYLVLGHRLRRWREFLGKALIIRMTRVDVFSIPGRGWQPCVAPYFATRGAWRHSGNEIPQQNRTPEVVRSRATTSPGMLGCATRGRGDMRGAGIADISRNACRRYAPRSLHAHPSQPVLSQLLIFLKNNCEKIWWIRQKAITLHSQSNARCHSSVGRAKD